MIAALILSCYAALVAMAAPALLRRFWPADRLPRLTLALLPVLTCSFLVAASTSGLAVAVTLLSDLSGLDPAIDACVDQLPLADTPIGALLGRLALAVSGGLVLRTLYCLVTTFATTRRRQVEHARTLRMLAVRDERLGVLILDHPAPACYCLPGGDIVITSGALNRLDGPQLEAVLEHERAHLSGRHHLVIALATALRRTIPRVGILPYAESETRRLVELIADDAAVARSGARAMVTALAAIGTGHAEPPDAGLGVLGIGSSPILSRVQRLAGLHRTLSRRGRIASRLAAGMLALLPLVLLVISARTIIGECPPDTDDAGQTIGVMQEQQK